VLPWRAAGPTWPDVGADTAGRTTAALARLRPTLVDAGRPVVWGGDWNHAMAGREYAGTTAGRAAIHDLLAEAGLCVVTAGQPHAIDGLLSIDHIAVPAGARVGSCRRVAAVADGRRLSDHDAYVVELGLR
jgi:endonuclease/exonuclease/phosphatase family metal-dependent hydrolase